MILRKHIAMYWFCRHIIDNERRQKSDNKKTGYYHQCIYYILLLKIKPVNKEIIVEVKKSNEKNVMGQIFLEEVIR